MTEVESAAPARRAKKKRMGKGPKILLSVLGGTLVIVLVIVGVLALRLTSAVNNVATIEDPFPDDALRPAQHATESGSPINILLLGSDTRGSGEDLLDSLGNRADTIMVAHIPPDRTSVQIMSIMRDSWVEIPGHGENKVNAALALGGVSLMVETVETIIDQRIDHVAVIDFEGFKGLTEDIGGVTLNNDVAFNRDEHSFEAGEITITDGDAALAYVRERYAFQDGDYQRVQNQQAFMRGMLNQLMSPDVLSNPFRIAELTDTMAPYIRRTDSLSSSEITSMGAYMVSASGGRPDINLFTLPTSGTGMIGDQSVVHVNWESVDVVREALKEDSMLDFEPPAAGP